MRREASKPGAVTQRTDWLARSRSRSSAPPPPHPLSGGCLCPGFDPVLDALRPVDKRARQDGLNGSFSSLFVFRCSLCLRDVFSPRVRPRQFESSREATDRPLRAWGYTGARMPSPVVASQQN